VVSTYGRLGPIATQIFRRLFRGSRIDEEAGPPLETRDPGQLGDDLEVPVEVVERGRPEWRAVEHQIVRRVLQEAGHALEHPADDRGQRREVRRGRLLVAATVDDRQHPGLERKAGREGSQGDEAPLVGDEAAAVLPLLADDVAPDAPLPDPEVL